MGGTEYGNVDLVFLQLFVHVFEVHAPYAVFVPVHVAVDNAATAAGDGTGEAYIAGRVGEYLLAGRGERIQRGGDGVQYAVFVGDVFSGDFKTVTVLQPGYDAFEIFLAGREITEGAVLETLRDRLDYRGRGDKVHVGNPHGNAGETFLYLCACEGNPFNGDGILALAVQNRSEIEFHM